MQINYGRFGRLALFGATMIWGTSFIILKSTLDDMGTMWVLSMRFTLATLILGFAAGKKLRKMDRQIVKGSIYMGLSLAAAYIVQTYGLFFTTPGKNSFLTSAYCVLVPFMAWGVYRRRPDASNVIAAFLCLAGIGLVSLGEVISDINKGDLLTLGCGVFYALQIIIMEQYVGKGDALSISTVQFATAAIICWTGALLFETAPGTVPSSTWFSIAYLGVMCTAVCFFLQAWGMKYVPSSTAAMILSLEAVFGTLFSVIFYHEQLTPKLLLGFALIFLSIIISEVKPKFHKGRQKV